MQSQQPEWREQPSGGSERKSKATLKTIGPLPGHSASLYRFPRLFLVASQLSSCFRMLQLHVLGHNTGTQMGQDGKTITQHRFRYTGKVSLCRCC